MNGFSASFAFVAGLATSVLAQDAIFEGLGFSGLGGGLAGSRADGVSPDGLVVVGGDDTTFGTRAVFWNAGSFFPQPFVTPAGEFALGRAFAVSEGGRVAVGSWSTFRDSEFVQVAISWPPSGLGVELEDLPDAQRLGSFVSIVGDVSNDGSIVVGVSIDERRVRQPVVWDPFTGAVTLLDKLPGRSGGQANRISADGRVIVGSLFGGTSGPDQIVTWVDGVPEAVDVGLPDGFRSFLIAGLSPEGKVVTGSAEPIDFDPFTNPIQPAIWRDGEGVILLDTVAGPGGIRLNEDRVLATSENGRRMVGTLGAPVSGGLFGAAIWFEDGSVRVLQDWLVNEFGLVEAGEWRALLEATSISDNGTVIVGYGINPLGIKEAWRVTLPSDACEPDIDGDGALTVFDFLAFQNLFDDQDARADLDGDGRFTIFDFLTFQTLFDAGCG